MDGIYVETKSSNPPQRGDITKYMNIGLSQKLNGDVFIEVDDAEDFVPEVKILFMNEDIKLTEEEKKMVANSAFNKIWEILKDRKNTK